MAEDLREDSGEFYPGGNVVTGVPQQSTAAITAAIKDINSRVSKLEQNGGGGSSVTVDDTLTQDGENPVKSKGIWSAIWGAVVAPATSVYEWVTSKLSGYAKTTEVPAAIAGKEINPSKVSITGDGVYVASSADSPLVVQSTKNNTNISANLSVIESEVDVRWSIFAAALGGAITTADYSGRKIFLGYNDREKEENRRFTLSVETGTVSYSGPEGEAENTIANMVNAMPRYPFVDADWVEGDADIDVDGGKATWLFIMKYRNSYYETSSSNLQNLFITLPEGETPDGLMRDAVLVIDMPEDSEHTVGWFMEVYPRGGDAANLEVVAGKRNVFFITEVQPNQFMVARDELELPDAGGGE